MKLHIRVVEAEGLPKMDIIGSVDPYVTLQLSSSKRLVKTTVKKKNKRPVWNEEFHFDVSNYTNDTLTAIIYDKDKISNDDPISRCQIPLIAMKMGEVEDKWYEMQPAEGVKKPGRLRMVTHFGPINQKPFEPKTVFDMPNLQQPSNNSIPQQLYSISSPSPSPAMNHQPPNIQNPQQYAVPGQPPYLTQNQPIPTSPEQPLYSAPLQQQYPVINQPPNPTGGGQPPYPVPEQVPTSAPNYPPFSAPMQPMIPPQFPGQTPLYYGIPQTYDNSHVLNYNPGMPPMYQAPNMYASMNANPMRGALPAQISASNYQPPLSASQPIPQTNNLPPPEGA